MITLPRPLTSAFAASACALLALATATAAHATPTVPTVPSSIGPISASDAMPQGGEARVTATCYTSGQPGGPITQSTVLARAAVWVTQNVPYTGACAQEPGGNYRLDCSGFVSMAWGLSTSLSTYNFNPAINGGDPRFVAISRANLLPGDAVVADNSSTHHIALFTGWDVNDNGQHRYADLSEESDFNVGTIAVTHQDLLGSYWGMFTPIRYTDVTHAWPSGVSAVFINGTYHIFWTSSSGQLVQAYYSGGWHGVTLGGSGLTGTPAATYHSGRLDVFATGSGGALYQVYFDRAWHPFQQVQSGWQPGVSALWDGQAYQVFGHNAAGHLLQGASLNGTWYVHDLGGLVAGTPAATFNAGRYDVVAVSPANNLLYQSTYTGRGWSAWQPVNSSTTYATAGASALWTGTSLHVFMLSATGSAQQSWYVGNWVGPETLGGSLAGLISAGYQNNQLDLFAPASGGGLCQRTYANGHWGAWQQIA